MRSVDARGLGHGYYIYMRRMIAAVVLLLVLVPAPASAWGAAAHRYMIERAVALLPPDVKRLFDRHRDELALRVNDPDLWREAGWDEGPNHFLNLGAEEYGRYPFTLLPREYGAAIEAFGTETVRRNGLLPWRVAEEFGNLRRAFGRLRGTTSASGDVVLFAAVAAHYVQDAYQPLHATNNFDGQRTGNAGVHTRFERDLFNRFETRLNVSPGPVRAMTAPREAAFEAILASHRMVEPLLKADRTAAAGETRYDAAYYDRFFNEARPILETQVAGAIRATAALILGAWQQADAAR